MNVKLIDFFKKKNTLKYILSKIILHKQPLGVIEWKTINLHLSYSSCMSLKK